MHNGASTHLLVIPKATTAIRKVKQLVNGALRAG